MGRAEDGTAITFRHPAVQVGCCTAFWPSHAPGKHPVRQRTAQRALMDGFQAEARQCSAAWAGAAVGALLKVGAACMHHVLSIIGGRGPGRCISGRQLLQRSTTAIQRQPVCQLPCSACNQQHSQQAARLLPSL